MGARGSGGRGLSDGVGDRRGRSRDRRRGCSALRRRLVRRVRGRRDVVALARQRSAEEPNLVADDVAARRSGHAQCRDAELGCTQRDDRAARGDPATARRSSRAGLRRCHPLPRVPERQQAPEDAPDRAEAMHDLGVHHWSAGRATSAQTRWRFPPNDLSRSPADRRLAPRARSSERPSEATELHDYGPTYASAPSTDRTTGARSRAATPLGGDWMTDPQWMWLRSAPQRAGTVRVPVRERAAAGFRAKQLRRE